MLKIPDSHSVVLCLPTYWASLQSCSLPAIISPRQVLFRGGQLLRLLFIHFWKVDLVRRPIDRLRENLTAVGPAYAHPRGFSSWSPQVDALWAEWSWPTGELSSINGGALKPQSLRIMIVIMGFLGRDKCIPYELPTSLSSMQRRLLIINTPWVTAAHISTQIPNFGLFLFSWDLLFSENPAYSMFFNDYLLQPCPSRAVNSNSILQSSPTSQAHEDLKLQIIGYVQELFAEPRRPCTRLSFLEDKS